MRLKGFVKMDGAMLGGRREKIKNRGYQVSFVKVWKGQLFSLDNKEGRKDTYSKK